MLSVLQDTWDAIKAIYTFLLSSVVGFFTYITDFIKYIITFLENVMKSLTDFVEDFVDFIKYLVQFLTNAIESFVDWLSDALPLFIDWFTIQFDAYFNLTKDMCEYCFDSLTLTLSSSVSVLSVGDVFSETIWYCIYQSDFFGALNIVGCGVIILVSIKILSVTLSVITLGIVRI
jgi:hypothetical protein